MRIYFERKLIVVRNYQFLVVMNGRRTIQYFKLDRYSLKITKEKKKFKSRINLVSHQQQTRFQISVRRLGVSLQNHTEELVVVAAFVVKVLQLMGSLRDKMHPFGGDFGRRTEIAEGRTLCILARKKIDFLSRNVGARSFWQDFSFYFLILLLILYLFHVLISFTFLRSK